MSDFLIDRTMENLIGAAEHAVAVEVGDLRVQILATRDAVMVRACMGGAFKTWIVDSCPWRRVQREVTNPLLGIIDGVIFRAERQAQLVAGGESGQQTSS